MNRRVSSTYTLLMKLLPMPLMVAAVVLTLIGIGSRTLTLFPDGVILLALILSALVFFLWYARHLKFVSLNDQELYISDLFKRGTIPISEVQNVYYSGVVGLVVVRLKSPTVFGSTITFMPTFGAGLLAALGSRSIVEELRDLAKKASSNSENVL
jgi:tellurite resistance protein TehA-like permease